MKGVFSTMVFFIITSTIYSQVQKSVIPITEKSGIYEMTSNTYKLLYPLTYETAFQTNDDESPKTDDCYYLIKKDNKLVFKLHLTFKDGNVCISSFNGDDNQSTGYTCIGFDKFLMDNEETVAQLCIVSSTKQFRIFYYISMKTFFITDFPEKYQSKDVVLHLLINTL